MFQYPYKASSVRCHLNCGVKAILAWRSVCFNKEGVFEYRSWKTVPFSNLMTRELVGHDIVPLGITFGMYRDVAICPFAVMSWIVVRRNIPLNQIANKGRHERKLVVMFFD